MSEETQEAVQDAPAVETPSVTVNDLVNVYAIIDLASKRGAFQAGELSAVGNTANRVKAFVDHVQPLKMQVAEQKQQMVLLNQRNRNMAKAPFIKHVGRHSGTASAYKCCVYAITR